MIMSSSNFGFELVLSLSRYKQVILPQSQYLGSIIPAVAAPLYHFPVSNMAEEAVWSSAFVTKSTSCPQDDCSESCFWEHESCCSGCFNKLSPYKEMCFGKFIQTIMSEGRQTLCVTTRSAKVNRPFLLSGPFNNNDSYTGCLWLEEKDSAVTLHPKDT